MSLHPGFPSSLCDLSVPAHRWFPADEAMRVTAMAVNLKKSTAQDLTARRYEQQGLGPHLDFINGEPSLMRRVAIIKILVLNQQGRPCSSHPFWLRFRDRRLRA
jgi:hypothetical protein